MLVVKQPRLLGAQDLGATRPSQGRDSIKHRTARDRLISCRAGRDNVRLDLPIPSAAFAGARAGPQMRRRDENIVCARMERGSAPLNIRFMALRPC